MRTRTIVGTVVLACAIVMTAASVASAQINFYENHYKVYMSTPIALTRDVGLRDQFGSFTVNQLTFDRFATPVTKTHNGVVYPPVAPMIHMDWWRFFVAMPERTIMVKNQFGDATWKLGAAVYLLTRSAKNVSPPPVMPPWNHYVCYDAVGPLVGQPVLLADQFGTVQVQVLAPRYFCNPAEKTVGGLRWDIVDPIVHLACYLVENPAVNYINITAADQFGFWQTEIGVNECLCVPSLKSLPVRTEHSTWGKVKALYRN